VQEALTQGFQRALLAGSIFLLAAAVLGLRTSNAHSDPALDAAAPAGEPAPV
jgi:hypothetical protein